MTKVVGGVCNLIFTYMWFVEEQAWQSSGWDETAAWQAASWWEDAAEQQQAAPRPIGVGQDPFEAIHIFFSWILHLVIVLHGLQFESGCLLS